MLLLGFTVIDILFYSQVFLSLLLPLAMIPLIYYTSRRKYMGKNTNNPLTVIIASICAGIIILLNIYSLI
jgi:manganese transport protein